MKTYNVTLIFLSVLLMIVIISTVSSCTIADSMSQHFCDGESHVLTKVDGVPATCTTDGIKEYYTCSDCDYLFADAEGKYIINAPIMLPKGHNITYIPADTRACEEGTIEHYSCSDCGAIFADEGGKNPLENAVHPGTHNPEIIMGKDSGCTEDGYSAYRVCKDCGERVTEPKVIPASHNTTPTAELWGVNMEVVDGRAYLVIYGGSVSDRICPDCGEPAPLKIAAELQHNDNIDGKGWKTAIVYADKNNMSSNLDTSSIVKPAVEASVKADLFEVYFDITDLEVDSTLIIHAGLDGAMGDLKNQGSGNGVEVFADGKRFSFRLDADTWKIASVVVSEAAENEFNLNGRVNLKEIDSKPYIVYQGSWNTKNSSKEAVEAEITAGLVSTFDIMELNTWARPAFDYILNVNDDGSITLALCLENLAPSTNVYYMHRALDNTNSGGDVKLPIGHDYSLTIGNRKYQIKKGSDAASWLSAFTVITVTEITE